MKQSKLLVTIGALFGLVAASFSGATASASPTSTSSGAVLAQATGPYAGFGSASLLEVFADIAIADFELAHAILSPVETEVDSQGDPRSMADAANLDAGLLDDAIELDEILTHAHQEAPPDNDSPEVDGPLIPIPADPLLDVGVSTSEAHARWLGDGPGECLPAGPDNPIARAYNETASADVLLIDDGAVVSVVNDEGGVSATQSSIYTIDVDGQSGRGLESQSFTQVDEVTLFTGTPLDPLGLSIAVVGTPTLTATATGAPGGASVTYNEPLVTITTPDGGALAPLEDLGEALDDLLKTVLPGLGGIFDQLDPLDPAVNVELSIGSDNLTEETRADGTGAAGEVWVVKLHIDALSALGDPLLDIDVNIGHMTAGVAVPVGGIDCDGVDEIDDPLRDVHKDATQAEVAPGGTFDYTLTVPNRGECVLTDVVVTDVITGPEGTVVTADPPPDSQDGLTLVWNIGELQPNETRTLTLTVQVPEDAPLGATYTNNLHVQGDCDGVPAEKEVDYTGPTVTDVFVGPCNLGSSNKSASHLEVMPGQTFNYFIHVFNQGAEPCTGISVVDTLDEQVSFVACTHDCTQDGQTVSWDGLSVGPGSGLTLTITVQNDAPVGSTLSNSAVIDSPDDSTGPHTVSHTGPAVTDQSVLAPPDPARIGDIDTLARTGGETNPLLPIALLSGGILAALAIRRRFAL